MTGGSLGQRTASYGSLQLLNNNGIVGKPTSSIFTRKPSPKMLLAGSRDREKQFLLLVFCKFLGRRRVAMLLLVGLPLLIFTLGSYVLDKENTSLNIDEHIGSLVPYVSQAADDPAALMISRVKDTQKDRDSSTEKDGNKTQRPSPPAAASLIKRVVPLHHPCENFAFPPPPPPGLRRPGPRPCPVCYVPVEQAIASMPSSPSESPVLQNLTYIHDENPVKTETHGGSDFGGYPFLKQRNGSYEIKESMTVHCGFVKGSRPGRQSGFDLDEFDLTELEQFHDVIVASAIFGNYDLIQQPKKISQAARQNVPFYMFVDEETEAYMKNSSILDSNKRVGLWRIIVVRNIPYNDSRRNGKVPKLLLHRIFPNVRYSIWIDGKLQLVVDPYQILERFLWRENATFAISRHYRRFDVFVEAEANKAAGKYDNASIDYQVEFYKNEGLTPYSEAKLPITSDVPEGCVIIREHIPITNLFSCLWFNEVDRFTARDQLSFSTVRDKIMAKVNWTVNMFLDCERRNFVIQFLAIVFAYCVIFYGQAYHRDLLVHKVSPGAATMHHQLVLPGTSLAGKNPGKRSSKRGKGEKRSGSKRHRKVAAVKTRPRRRQQEARCLQLSSSSRRPIAAVHRSPLIVSQHTFNNQVACSCAMPFTSRLTQPHTIMLCRRCSFPSIKMSETNGSRVRDNIQSTESNEVSDMSPMTTEAQSGSKRKSQEYSCKSIDGTSNLLSHLKMCFEYESYLQNQATLTQEPTGAGNEEIDDNIISIRNAVKYVRSSSARLKTFQIRVEQEKILGKNGQPFRGSVVLDCPTRWNSIYTKLATTLKFRSTFDRMANDDKLYNEGGKKNVGPPGSYDWDNARRMVRLLRIFYDATLAFSFSLRVTYSTCYNEICKVEKTLNTIADGLDPYINPRGKMNFATLCFETLYGKDNAKCAEMKNVVKDVLNKLFEAYSAQHLKPSATASASASVFPSASAGVSVNSGLTFMDEDNEVFEDPFSKYTDMVAVTRDHIKLSNELDLYLMESVEYQAPNALGAPFVILLWWKANSLKYPILSHIARDVFVIPISTVASESTFSMRGRILDEYRSSMTPDMVEALILTQN
ncbi:putative tRNA (met) cytidine acetyltransferase [Citrus sinensis]|nr:putative tRNA (met) cytidine acetyltransferase [Citrus sinensis]